MQKEELFNIVVDLQKYQCELQTVEAKAANAGCPTRLYGILSSFSNQDGGGIIIFGVDESKNFEVVGVYNAQDLQHRVIEQCKQMQPSVRPLFSVADVNGKIVVSAEIPGVDIVDRPVYYKGTGRLKGSFIRVGAVNETMSDYEIYSYDAYHRRIRDDVRLVENTDFSIFNEQALNIYLNLIKENKPNLSKLADNEILELMAIIKTSKPTLTGVLLFSKYPQSLFPQLCITAVVVPGTEMGQTGIDNERFWDNKRIEGTIPQMLDEAILFVKRNMRVKTIIDEDGKRNDKYEYPLKAVREAILNALMHRDYSIHTEGTPVQLIMYYDRLEIINQGGLYGKLTIDGLGKIHADTRNQNLTNALEILKVAENRYSGIPTIRLEMKDANLPEPIFESKRGAFIVTLKNSTEAIKDTLPVKSGNIKTDVLSFCSTEKNRGEIANFTGFTPYYAMKVVVMPLINEGKLRMTIPEKPKSRYQRYITRKK